MTTDPVVINAHNPKNAMDKQSRLMFALPTDIVLEIFKYLNQQDCLTCMAVCHEWYDKVPQYAQNIWKKVRLNTQYASEDHKRVERCLGDHVKHVVISPVAEKLQVEQEQLHFIMRKLIDRNCIEIESFELRYGVTAKDQAAFVDLLKRLAPRLTQLKLPSHMSDVHIMHLLYAFPEITSFTCCYSGLSYVPPGVSVPSSMPDDLLTKLTYLSLGMCRVTKKEKEFLLKRSPNLRCYADQDHDNSYYGVDLYSLLQWCPKLNMITSERSTPSELESCASVYLNNEAPGLRYLCITKNPEFDQVSTQLVKNQDTLEYLDITNALLGYDWTQASELVQLPSLRTLICRNNHFTAESFIATLNRAPLLDAVKVNMQSSFTFGLTVNRSLGTLHHLRHLAINNVMLDSGLSLLTLLEHFPVLEKLQLSNTTLPLKLPVHFEPPKRLKHLELNTITWAYEDENDKEGATARFIEGLAGSSKLEHLQLGNTTTLIGYKPLQIIAKIQSLRYLEVQLDQNLQEQELLKFVKLLQTAAIETLMLRCVPSLPCAVLDALADFPRLAAFHLERGQFPVYYTRINKEGLLKLLCKSPKLVALMLDHQFTIEAGNELLRIDQLVALLKEQAPHFEVSPIQTPGWAIIASNFFEGRHLILSGTAITRVNKPLQQ